MSINNLTDNKVKNAKAKEKTYTLSDGAGMGLEVTPKGSKRWRFRYRFHAKAKLVSLGVYPDVSLATARKRRDDARTFIADGIDPFPSREQKKLEKEHERVTHEQWSKLFNEWDKLKKELANKNTHKSKHAGINKKIGELSLILLNSDTTFKQWTKYYKSKIQGEVSDAHIERSEKGWKKDVFPVVGDKAMNDIEAKHIISILHVMTDRGVKESAKKVFSSISRVFDIAIANFPDHVKMNPCKSVSLKDVIGKSEKSHYPIITDPKELGALLVAIDEYKGHSSTRLALKMISHTFTRPFNIRHAKWEEIDIKKKQWVIPASQMKTKKELIVPLSSQVLNILAEAKTLSGESILVFPAPKGLNTALSDASMVGALRRLGYSRDEIVAHSFRGIFSTISNELGEYSHNAIETQLAHSVGSSVSQAYNRALYLPERVQMMQWYSNLLEGYSYE